MKIAIIGYGFVGKALSCGFNNKVYQKIIDPKLNSDITELDKFDPEVIFICVPTPMSDDGSQDISIVRSVINEINNLSIRPIIVLKSTVLPNYILEIEKTYPKFVYNPEFLREKHANEDFVNADLIVFGGKKENTSQIAKIYSEFTNCVSRDYIHTDIQAASFIKYSINSFLAMKVIFFNELKVLYDVLGVNENWKNFIDFISRDTRLGKSHMYVPGHDGRKGFGGACLPKDSNALLKFSEMNDKPLTLLKKAININNEIRSQYNNKTEREIDQNIKYKGDN